MVLIRPCEFLKLIIWQDFDTLKGSTARQYGARFTIFLICLTMLLLSIYRREFVKIHLFKKLFGACFLVSKYIVF